MDKDLKDIIKTGLAFILAIIIYAYIIYKFNLS